MKLPQPFFDRLDTVELREQLRHHQQVAQPGRDSDQPYRAAAVGGHGQALHRRAAETPAVDD
ncbi:MAG: hypothetical protein R2708_24010 [Vicinamibacterales bacterium]